MTSQQYDVLVLGSGAGGKLLSWHKARAGRRTAVVERKWIGGSCQHRSCWEGSWIWSAKVADLVNHATAFGIVTGTTVIDMRHVRQRKREMVDGLITMHLDQYRASGAELIMGAARVAGTMAAEAEERRTAPRQINSDMA
jgi:pyruvate/2-oxoglutarate dehydrogenase complex dihydrolipoamide dehydrogenase (E3) component